MSWDVYLMRCDPAWTKIADIPSDYAPPVIGTFEEILAKIQILFPHAYVNSFDIITIDGETYRMELAERSDEITGFMAKVRGGSEASQHLIQIANCLEVAVMDGGTGVFLDKKTALESWGGWVDYRNQILGKDATE